MVNIHNKIIFFAMFIATIGYGISFSLLSIGLDGMGASATMVGLNASMPAFGWIIALPFLPFLQTKFGLGKIFTGCLLVALIAMVGFLLIKDIWAWFIFRLLFGGSLGFFYRVIEFWTNHISTKENRGKTIGIYGFIWVLGIIVGSYMHSLLPAEGALSYYIIMATIFIALILFIWQSPNFKRITARASKMSFSVFGLVPIAMMGVFIYALNEDLAAYLMSIYALKIGHSEELAILTLTFATLGMLAFSIPVGYLSDKIDRVKLIIIFTIATLLLSLAITIYSADETSFLILLFIWGGFLGSIYNVSLSIIGDRFEESELVTANATYGLVYAFGSVVGPSLAGITMDIWPPNGALYCFSILFFVYVVFSILHTRRGVNV